MHLLQTSSSDLSSQSSWSSHTHASGMHWPDWDRQVHSSGPQVLSTRIENKFYFCNSKYHLFKIYHFYIIVRNTRCGISYHIILSFHHYCPCSPAHHHIATSRVCIVHQCNEIQLRCRIYFLRVLN